MRRVAAVFLALLPSGAAFAVTLGALDIQSSLGQRLRMIVQLSVRPDEQIDPGCFKINPFTVSSDGLPQLTAANVVLERTNGEARLLVSSTRQINDPIVRLSIDVGCDTTLRRDLTLLLDPPPVVERLAETAPAAAPAAPAAAGTRAGSYAANAQDSATGGGTGGSAAGASASAAPAATQTVEPTIPLTARGGSGRGDSSSPPPSRRADASAAPSAARPSTAAPPRSAARRTTPLPPPPPATATARTGGQRDRLTISTSAPPGDTSASAPLAPRLTLATSLADRKSAALPESALAMLRQKQARLRAAPADEDMPSLEAELAVLQKRTSDLRSQIDSLMAQMQALNEKSAAVAAAAGGMPAPATSPAVKDAAATPVQSLPPADLSQRYALDGRWLFTGTLIVLLALLLAALWVWIRRERAEARRTYGAPDTEKTSRTMAARRNAAAAEELPERPLAVAAVAAGAGAPAATARSQDNFAFTTSGHAHAASQLGVSDLAQATEKASVFMTHGRTEQAIDVLRDNIDHESKPSPMAWLMLIDLYRKTRRRFEFDETAERFHQTFNVEAPHWDEPLDEENEEGLAGSPRVLAHIRELWPRPEALEYIETLLYDNRGGSRVGFSLSAFRDLLLLHSSLEEYLLQLHEHANDADADDLLRPEPPMPPAHLRNAWSTAAGEHGAGDTPTFELDVNLLGDPADSSAIERGLPAVADAIVSRWGKPGAADYLTNLIALSKDDRNSDVSTDMLSELVMLQNVACELEESRSRDLSY